MPYVYDLRSTSLPKLHGPALRAFTAALFNPLTRGLLLPSLLRQSGFDRFQALRLHEAPTSSPLRAVPAPAEAGFPPAHLSEQLTGAAPSGPFATVRAYADAYGQGRVTPTIIAERVLEALAASDSGAAPLRAFIACQPDDVRRQAVAAAQRWAAGRPLSPFDGVPVAVKDEVDQIPYPTTVGTTFLGHTAASQDATVVARLRGAGALLIGKANMHEIGINPTSFNGHYGTVRNPYDLTRDAGGSSSGSAAAVAAGFCPVAVGADGGGSIRVPASLCGVVGLKPTYGRVSEAGAAPLCWSVAHLGPLGATVEDVALAYAVMAGPDPRDAHSRWQPPVSLADWARDDLRGLRLGIYSAWNAHATPEVSAACETLVARLVEAGATAREISIPELDAMRLAHAITILTEMAASLGNQRERWGELAAVVRTNLGLTAGFTAADYVLAQRMRTRALAIFDQLFTEVDAIISPATALAAPLLPLTEDADGWSDLGTVVELMRYAFAANLTGLPAISFPAGYDAAGLPLGVQAMGRHWEEATLLRIAHVAERATPRRRPPLWYDILNG